MKKIFNVAENVSLESGGQRTAVVNLHNFINSNNNYSSIIVTNKKEKEDLFVEFKPKNLSIWNYSAAFNNYLNDHLTGSDILHLHGAWMQTQYAGYKTANKKNIPYVITLHGMIEPWYLKQKELKKKIYLNLILSKILDKSKVIHVITASEKENIYKLTKHKNIVEIPNFINLTQIPFTPIYNPNEEYLLFLSRIHPGKGLDILIDSMSKIDNKKIKLKIAGTENEYSNILKKKISDLKLEKRIEFIGSIYGDEKFNLFANAKAFIAPSYSEAIGMVNLEAAICKTPVITTFNTGISPEWNKNGGIMINPTCEELTLAINEVMNWNDFERIERGELICKFVSNNYSWENKGHLWVELYNSL